MNRTKVLFYTFVSFVIIIILYSLYGYINYQVKKSDFTTYEITGRIKKLLLVTTFPNEGLYIGFDNGEYRFVNINYWWTYANLDLIKSYNNVTITYERNYFGDLRVLHIKEIIPK